MSLEVWLEQVLFRFRITRIRISAEVAAEASRVPVVYGSGDPGDCFVIATARVHALLLMTRDELILELAEREPEYVVAMRC